MQGVERGAGVGAAAPHGPHLVQGGGAGGALLVIQEADVLPPVLVCKQHASRMDCNDQILFETVQFLAIGLRSAPVGGSPPPCRSGTCTPSSCP